MDDEGAATSKFKVLASLLQGMRSDGSRSSALSTLAKVLTAFGVIIVLAIKANAPMWLLIVLVSFLGLFALVMAFLYVYFALKSPDRAPSPTVAGSTAPIGGGPRVDEP